ILGAEVDESEYSIDSEDPLEIRFGDTDKAYRVLYVTDINDYDGTTYSNTATVTGDNDVEMTANSSVGTERGTPLSKRSVRYDEDTQTITWEIKYNYNLKNIPKKDAVLIDSFSNIHEF